MSLPAGVTESDFLEAVHAACELLTPSFVFGYMSVEDIRQQAALFALAGVAVGEV